MKNMKFFDFFKTAFADSSEKQPESRYYKQAPPLLGKELAKRENLDSQLL